MTNQSIFAAFERMWQHVTNVVSNKADKADLVPSDWNQNDETASDYVKNRTHYMGMVNQELIVEQEIANTTAGNNANTIVGECPITEKSVFYITMDGTTYVSNNPYYYESVPAWYFGGISVDDSGQLSIDYTVCPLVGFVQIAAESYITIVITEDGGSHTVSVTMDVEKAIPLDEKFIPDSVKANPDWNQNDETSAAYIQNRPFYEGNPVETVVLEEQTFTSAMTGVGFGGTLSGVSLPIESGQTYTVIYDGVPYNTQTIESTYGPALGNLSLMIAGEEDSGEPFVILSPGEGNIGIGTNDTESKTHTFSVNGIISTVYKIPDKFLPTLVGRSMSGVEITDDEGNVSICGVHSETFNSPDNIASGVCSHAEGINNKALGNASHAEGENNIASDACAHVEGWDNIASGVCSHAEGHYNEATEYCSHVEGYGTIASGKYAHAEGYKTIATNDYQHVQGKYNVEDTGNEYAHIVGNGRIYAENGVTHEERSNAHTLDWSGNAWFAGDVYVGGTGQDDATALMKSVDPVGTGSFSMNRKADTTVGNYSVAEGYNITASGAAAHAEGNNTTASGNASHAEGGSTTASGEMSHAEGSVSKATAKDAHAEGTTSTASGIASHAEGTQTTASAAAAHAEGMGSVANGNGSHAEGFMTTANGDYSHTEGQDTLTGEPCAHAEGLGTVAVSANQHVQGKYNVADYDDTYAHIIGNGEGESDRSNAHTVTWDGKAWYAGQIDTEAGLYRTAGNQAVYFSGTQMMFGSGNYPTQILGTAITSAKAITTSSDERGKSLFDVDMEALKSFVSQVNLVGYSYNDSPEERHIGVLAQQLLAIDPEIASYFVREGVDGFYSVDYQALAFAIAMIALQK